MTAPAPDERTRYSSQRPDALAVQAWPSSAGNADGCWSRSGQMIHPKPDEVLWDAGELYDLYLVLAGGVGLVDQRDARVAFVVEAGDFVGELGMLMGQPAFLGGVAMEGSTLLRVPVQDLRQLVATSAELGDVLLSAFDARRRLLTRWGEGGLSWPATTIATCTGSRSSPSGITSPTGRCLRSDSAAWAEIAATCALPPTGTAVVTGGRRVLTEPTTRDLATAIGLDLCGLPDQARCDLLIVGAGPAGLAAAVYGPPKDLRSSSSKTSAWEARRAHRRGSRTTSVSPAAFPAASWPGWRCCRRSSLGRGSSRLEPSASCTQHP